VFTKIQEMERKNRNLFKEKAKLEFALSIRSLEIAQGQSKIKAIEAEVGYSRKA